MLIMCGKHYYVDEHVPVLCGNAPVCLYILEQMIAHISSSVMSLSVWFVVCSHCMSFWLLFLSVGKHETH